MCVGEVAFFGYSSPARSLIHAGPSGTAKETESIAQLAPHARAREEILMEYIGMCSLMYEMARRTVLLARGPPN